MTPDPYALRDAQARHGHAIGGLKSQQGHLRGRLGACEARQARLESRVLLLGVSLACFLATVILGRIYFLL